MKILVIEDEMKISEFIKEGLEFERHEVETAWNGEDGIKMASENKYDTILLDILLPKINGFQVHKQVRSQRVETISRLNNCWLKLEFMLNIGAKSRFP